jgi:hypothetical protein
MKIIFILAVVLVVVAVIFSGYMGAFDPVVITEVNQAPVTLVYREMTGTDMKQVAEVANSVKTVLTGMPLTRMTPFDVFYPDGQAEIGFAVQGASALTLSRLSKANAAKIRVIPAQKCMKAMIRWRNSLSYLLGPLKLVPALAAYRAAHGYKEAENYALDGKWNIVYLQPISR